MAEKEESQGKRLEKILLQVEEFAKRNFHSRGKLSGKGDEIDALVAGLNTLGEELLFAESLPDQRTALITEAVLKIIKGDYSFRAPVSERSDSIDAVATALNTLAEELEYKNSLSPDIFHNAPSGVIIIDQDSVIMHWNPQAEIIFGWKAPEVIGKHLYEIIIPERFREAHKKGMNRFLKTGEGPVINRPIELPALHKDGTEFNAGITISPSYMGGKHFFIGFITDLTYRTRQTDENTMQLAAIVEASQDAIISKTLDGTIRSWNKGAEKIFGYTVQEAIGQDISMLIPASGSNEEKEIFKRVRGDERIEHYETVRKRKDGKEIDVSLSIFPLKDSSGNVIGASTIVRDITARKKSEKETRERAHYVEGRINELLDVLLKITMMDFSHKVPVGDKGDEFDAIAVGLNTLSEEMESNIEALREKDEKQARLLHELQLTTEQMERKNQLLAGLAEMNEILRGQKEIPVLVQDVINKLVPYLNGQIGAFYTRENNDQLAWAAGYAYNKKDATRSLIRFGEGLSGQAAFEKKLILFNNIPEDYFRINSALGEISPKNILCVPLLFAGSVEGVIEIGSAWAFTPQQMEYIRLVSESVAIALNSARSRTKMKELLEETQRQAEELGSQQEELQQTNEELEEKARVLEEQTMTIEKAKTELENKAKELHLTNQYKSDFLSTMSHELRTPLNSILILARILLENRSKKLSDREVEYARNIHDSGTELLELINEILDLAKIESGKTEIEPENVAFTGTVQKMNAMFSEVARARSIKFSINYNKKKLPSSIYTDRQRLDQILKNLLSNAFKFTGSGGKVRLDIDLAAGDEVFSNSGLGRAEKVIAFAVTDTGIGIPKEKQSLVFEAFRQADSSTRRKFGGSGLGLSISKELAGLLGGEIHLQSKVNKGSVFTLFLPVSSGFENKNDHSAESKALASVLQPMLPAAVYTGKIKDDRESIQPNDRVVLIIEDDLRYAQLLLDFVRERNYKGVVAEQGNKGLEFARIYRPDAILLDPKLPLSEGRILRQLKSDAALKHIPVQVIPARNAGKTEKIFDFVQRPLKRKDFDIIFSKIENLSKKKVKKLLVVEDNKKENRAICHLINSDNVKCTASYSGEDAYRKLLKKKFDAVILDLGLPDTDGIKLLKKIRNNSKVAAVPVIVYTGRDLDKKESRQLSDLASTVVLKTPNSAARLLDETSLFLRRVEATMPKEKKHKNNGEDRLKGRKILIADDDMRNVYALANVMDAENIHYLTAENGREAVELLKKNPDIELVLMDIMMPEMSGFEATAEIRKMERFKKLPIIALTAKAMKGMPEKCIAAGMSDYIAKPVDIDKLFSLMRVWLFRQSE